jgi:ComF family protein
MYVKIKNFILELFFPSFCLNCQKLGHLLCKNCYNDLKFYFSQNKIQEIKSNLKVIYFDDLQIMAKFEGSLAKLIKALKYQDSKNIAPLLSKMLWRHLIVPQVDFITFIPLHPYKLRARGYNQCQEIALEFGRLANTPVKNLLERTKNIKAQAKIKNQQERLQRMQNTFQIRSKYKDLIKNKTIILIDDVLTTGATLNAASKTLKDSGAKAIFGLIVASKNE